MKIAHFQLTRSAVGSRMADLTARIECLRGVVGAVAVRSMGLLTVLYDEVRTDPVRISESVAGAQLELEREASGDARATRPRRAGIAHPADMAGS